MTLRHHRRALISLGCGVVVTLTGLSHLSARQVRAASTTAAPAGRIAGVIVDSHGQPVARAIVTLKASELPAGLADVSDDQGHFSFDRLPAGHFTLSVSKPAYLSMTFGALRPGGAGTPIGLGPDQQLTDLRLVLPHGGAIGGTIRDAHGDPVPNLEIYVIRTNGPVSAPPLRSDAALTDDRGAFRAFGLLPGTYVVCGSPGLSGGLGEVGQMSTADVDAAFARLRQPSRGAATAPTPRASTPSSIVRPTQSFSPIPVYYPGVTVASAAQTITLGLGEERTDVDFVYQLARAAAVSGTLSGADVLSNFQVTLSPEGVTFPLPLSIGTGPLTQRNGDPSTFRFTNVTPGRYTLAARSGGPQSGAARGVGGPVTAQPLMFARVSIDVVGEDIDGIALTLQPAPKVSGRLIFQGAMTPPADLTKIRVRLTSASPGGNAPVVSGGFGIAQTPATMGVVQADGTFLITGVLPGAYRISTIGEPGAWRAKSAMAGEHDRFDVPLEVSSDVTDVAITLSDQHSHLKGRLLLSTGSPAAGYFVVAFPSDRALWVAQSRRMKSARPSTDGQFQIDDLPAGTYFLAALTDADQEDWQSPAFLAQLTAASVSLVLADGETKTQDLKVAK